MSELYQAMKDCLLYASATFLDFFIFCITYLVFSILLGIAKAVKEHTVNMWYLFKIKIYAKKKGGSN